MKKHILQGLKREVKKVKPDSLRKEGFIPATVYGKKVTSESLTIRLSDFIKVYGEAHETGLVELVVDGGVKPVLIHHVQKDPVKDSVLHVELHQVDLKEKVRANVPLVLIGEAPAVAQKTGAVLSLLSEVEVEALPTDLPEKLDVDVSGLSEVGQELKVANISAPSAVTILTDLTVTVARVGELVSKAAEDQAAADAAVAEAASAEGSEAVASGGESAPDAPATEKNPDEEKKAEGK